MALQALLPVIGNIQGYQREIEAESEGYTYMKEIDYRSTPYGQLKQAEAEREAILYGTGEKTVGVRTAIMKLENTMLKFIQKLPEPVLSAGYSAGKGFEAMGGITSSVANLAIINALGKKGGMLGNFGPVLTGASLAVPIATAVAGALATSIQEGKRQDDEEWSEENKGLDPLLAAQNTMRNIKYLTEDDQNALTSNMPLYIGDSIYGDAPGEGISKMFLRSFGKSYSFMEGGEIQDQEFVSNRLRMIEELYAQSQENVIKRLPMDEESKDALSKKMSAENDWMQTINLASLDPNNVIEALKSTGKTFGDMSGLEEDDYVGRQKRTYDNIEKYIGDLGIDPSKLPDTGDIRLPESLISMRNMLLNKQGDTTWGDDDVMNLSKEEIRKGITEHFSTDAYKGLDAETKQDVVQYYVDAIQKLTDISGNFNEIKQIIENINNNTAELTQSEEAAYMEQFAAWKSGATSLDVLPGPNGAYMKGIWDEEGNMYPMAGGLFNQDMRSEYERHNDALRSHLPNGGEGFEFPMDTYKEGKVGVDIRALFNVADMGNKIVQSFDTLGTIFSGALNRGGPL
jgi:hypothetical protein